MHHLFCVYSPTGTTTYLLYLPDPSIHSALEVIKERRVFHFVAEVTDLRLPAFLCTLLYHHGNSRMNRQGDLGYFNVLLKMQQSHLELFDLLLNRRGHLVSISEQYELPNEKYGVQVNM